MIHRKTSDDSNRHLFCNYCQTDTNHTSVGEHISSHVWEGPDQTGYYRFWICDGCEHPTLEITSLDFERDDNREIIYLPYFEHNAEDAIYYPPRTQSAPKYFRQIPKQLNELYSEIITTL